MKGKEAEAVINSMKEHAGDQGTGFLQKTAEKKTKEEGQKGLTENWKRGLREKVHQMTDGEDQGGNRWCLTGRKRGEQDSAEYSFFKDTGAEHMENGQQGGCCKAVPEWGSQKEKGNKEEPAGRGDRTAEEGTQMLQQQKQEDRMEEEEQNIRTGKKAGGRRKEQIENDEEKRQGTPLLYEAKREKKASAPGERGRSVLRTRQIWLIRFSVAMGA